ncbi:MAG: class I SAM-dependent methyltransferase [Bacilli bacterium]|nr:class I SAM-dependent methyltransferase [Bacilli bacterium]
MEKEAIAKAWVWEKAKDIPSWLTPSKDVYYLSHKWKEEGKTSFMDFGTGLGRHAIYFASEGFEVKAFDLSPEAVETLKKRRGTLPIEVKLSDMHHVDYPDECVDALLAYHVVSHTNRKGIDLVVGEIYRLLKPQGEFFLDLCAKDGWMFTSSGYPKLDEDTVISQEEGPEYGVPHLCVNLEDIKAIFKKFSLLSIEKIISFDEEGKEKYRHYWILGKKE